MHRSFQRKLITLGLPCLNEEKNIKKIIGSCIKVLEKEFDYWELIIVDNKSSDLTIYNAKKKISTFSKKIKKNIKLIQNKKNIFYSGSVEKIINNSKFQYICILDSDNQYSPLDIIKLYKFSVKNNIDLVIGNRKNRKDNLFRIIVTFFFNFISKILIGSNIDDLNSGIKLLKKINKVHLVKKINASNPELFCIYKKANKNISQIDVKHYHRKSGESVNSLKNVLLSVINYLNYLFKLKLKYNY